ncbi:hypothetical protein [Pseudomonas sp.]|uniref:hypothetical protein n=1 Tax=Pseudomonas sp. TaxID=306 RepID=UPI002735CE0D|nr:hypothetical protein [Pseudomonas sp.]MDP3816634.1 hypothetical protein [Pseudomonas sp.]
MLAWAPLVIEDNANTSACAAQRQWLLIQNLVKNQQISPAGFLAIGRVIPNAY